MTLAVRIPRVRMSAGRLAIAILITFLVAFPKAGFKVGSVPVTFGYLLLGAVALACTLQNSASRRYAIASGRAMAAFGFGLPLQAVTLLLAGLLGSAQPSLTVAFVVGFVALPTFYLLLLGPQIRQLDADWCGMLVRRCVSFAALYGIFLFCYHLASGRFIEIPFLTVNADDAGLLESGKNIDRGNGFFKLISTYNNGNIYGVCILMLLPWYELTQRSLLWRLLVRLSLILTLSRTVWFGAVIYEMLAMAYLRPLRARTLLYFALTIAAIGGAVAYIMQKMGFALAFLLDPNLGGRTAGLARTHLYFLPHQSVEFSSEIIYATVVNAFGLLGGACLLLSMTAPLFLAGIGRRGRDPLVRACVAGMAMLLVCGLSDGPILLIPVMALYWGLAAIALLRVDPATLASGTQQHPGCRRDSESEGGRQNGE